MKTLISSLKLAPVLLLALGAFTGCESTDGGGSGSSANVYYGVGLYDPWYYGDYHDHADVIVTPPRPEQPIARPPSAAAPRPTPMPSIPSMPRASFRR